MNTTVISYLANADLASGTVNASWNPSPQFHVYDIAADTTHLYCGGSFSRMGAGGPPYLTRVSLATGTVDTSWAPNPNGLVTSVAVSGDSVYAAGTWTLISSTPQQWIARAAKAASGADGAWRPPVDGAVRTLVSDGGNGVWAGGRFSSPKAAGSGLAHFLSNPGTAVPSYPGRIENTGAVKAVVADSGGWICGGDFDTVNGTRLPALFRIESNGALAGWGANLQGFYPRVNAMDLIPEAAGGAELIIAGQFEYHNGTQILYNCLKLRAATGAVLTAFAPLPDNEVQAMVRHGNAWVLGGNFDKLGNASAPALARITGAGLVDAGWKPQPDGPVLSLLSDGDDLYAGGMFSSFGKPPTVYPVPFLARVVGLVPDLGWQPRPNDAVFAMATDGAHLYAGGRFTKMARTKRQFLAQLPIGGAGTATAWNPKPDQSVHALRIDGNYLYTGGAFFGIAGLQWPKLARFRRTDLTLDQTFRTTGEDGFVASISPQSDGSLFIGGTFSGWDDSFDKRGLVRIQPGPPQQPSPPPDLSGDDSESDDTLGAFFAGDFSRSLVSPLSVETGPGLEWKENPLLPAGMVAQVQWSHDLKAWHESGDSADGLTRLITITMDGNWREARVLTEGSPPGDPPQLYLRLAVIPGNASSPLHP